MKKKRNIFANWSYTKTKVMRINTASNPFSLLIDDEPSDDVESFCYLECIIAKDGGANMRVENRTCKS